MVTLAKRFGVAALTGLSVVVMAGLAGAQPAPDIFRPVPGPGAVPGGGGAGGFGYGFGVASGNPLAGIVTNPYGAQATLTSRSMVDPYSSNSGFGGYGYPYSYSDPYGGFLRGAADVINAQGQFMIQNQQALQLRESVRQARIDTRRRVFDEWLYERANTPTLQDELERRRREEIRRSLNDPPVTEIWSSKALNDLLAAIQDLHNRKVDGPAVPVDEDLLKHVNVTAARGGGNIALVRNEGRLAWPTALMSPDSNDVRSKIDSWVLDARNQANTGRVDPQLIRDFGAAVTAMQSQLTRNVSDIPFAQYTEARRFLNNLEDAVKILNRPDAASYLNGKYAARGRTVQDVVKHMTDNGLEFAPAITGDEAAYNALHRWMVSYHTATKSLVAER